MNEMSTEQMYGLESGQRVAKQHGDATFMTSVQNQGLQSQKTSKGVRSKKEFSEDQLGPATGAEKEEDVVEEGSFLDGSDIDLNASYSDSDKEVPFKQSKEVIEYLFDLERQDRTEINRVQDNEQSLEMLKKESAAKIA